MIIAYKGLHLLRDGTFRSSVNNSRWTGVPPRLRARCLLQPTTAGHLPPVDGCVCGIYVVNDLSTLPTRGYGSVAVAVRVWGKLQEYIYGYRAEFAEIDAVLSFPCQHCHLDTFYWGNFLRKCHMCFFGPTPVPTHNVPVVAIQGGIL